jgi:hypothetical protein
MTQKPIQFLISVLNSLPITAYFIDIKAQVIQECLAGGTSYRQLSAKYGMSRDVINKMANVSPGYS